MQEVWKTITEFGYMYQISNLGNVKSYKRNTEKYLSLHIDNKGYYRVAFYHKSKSIHRKVHQLVATYFLNHKPCGMKLVVDHINGIKTDNKVENLQIITNRQNCQKKKGNHSSKYVGVTWNKARKKYVAQIMINKKAKGLGYFTCEIEASQAYINELKKHNL